MTERTYTQPRVILRPPLSASSFLGRAARSAVLWVAFGIVLGGLMGHERDMIGTISFAIAGAIVTFMPGVVLGLLGGQTKETLICGMGGAFVGVILSQIETHTPLSYCMGVGLIVGGIVGANYSALCYWRRLLVAETPS